MFPAPPTGTKTQTRTHTTVNEAIVGFHLRGGVRYGLAVGSLAVLHTNIARQSCLVLPTPRMQMSRRISCAYTHTGSAVTVSRLLSSSPLLSFRSVEEKDAGGDSVGL